MNVDWVMVSAIATAIYGLAFLFSLGFVVLQLRRQAEERFVASTAPSFEIWLDDDFQKAQQWILYGLEDKTWQEFVAHHRGDYGERAFLRVGAYYNRIGYLVVYHLLGKSDLIMLDTLAGPAISVWNKIEPLVLEARLIENSTLFQDFERMLPRCVECYAGSLNSPSTNPSPTPSPSLLAPE